jgi:lactate dehydrogenase-like 2-hydroxyacid dehydrogenase
MKIVVADPVMLPENYERKLGTLGELEVYNSMPASSNDYIERIKDAEVLLVGKSPISHEIFQHAPNLKMICVCHTGYDNVDV